MNFVVFIHSTYIFAPLFWPCNRRVNDRKKKKESELKKKVFKIRSKKKKVWDAEKGEEAKTHHSTPNIHTFQLQMIISYELQCVNVWKRHYRSKHELTKHS